MRAAAINPWSPVHMHQTTVSYRTLFTMMFVTRAYGDQSKTKQTQCRFVYTNNNNHE